MYGQLIPTLDASSTAAQHVGFGRALMGRAEEIAVGAGFDSVVVISGIGARNYYRRGLPLVESRHRCILNELQHACVLL